MAQPGSPRRILLAGATGYIGRAVAAELILRGDHVIAPVRPAADGAGDAIALPSGCEVRVTRLTDPAESQRDLADLRVDAAISCLASRTGVASDAWAVDHRANRAVLAAAQKAGAGQFVLLSAICVQKPRLAFQHAKLAFEAELAEAAIDHTIVRPTAFFKSLAGQVARVQAGKAYLLFGDGTLTACKPIGEADLARYLVDCLDDPSRRNRTLPIGGPGGAVTPRQQGELLFELAGLPAKFRSVPVAMFSAALGALTPLGKLAPGLAEKAELARIGRYYATESMLVWNRDTGTYDAAATPETGSETLRDFYSRVLREGLAGQELGAQKLF